MIRRAMRLVAVLVTLASVTSAADPARAAGEAAGTAAGSFLAVGAGASVLSMAGATLASGEDLAAAAWNPASLARVDALQFSLSHAPLPGGTTQDWLAAGGRWRGGETRWALHALFHQEGPLEGRDAANNPTGTLSVSDLALGARLARPLGSVFSAGAGAEWVHESLAGANGAGFAFDAGLRAEAGSLGLAVAARNVGGGMNYGGTRYDLPGVIAAGLSWSDRARGLRLNADFESPLHYYRDVRVGGEWMWRERVALRTGYRLELGAPADERSSGVTFGLGAGIAGTWMDYGYTPEGATGAGQHRLGLTFRPGSPGGAIADARRASAAAAAANAPRPAPREPKPTVVRETSVVASASARASTPAATPSPRVTNPPVPATAPAAAAPAAPANPTKPAAAPPSRPAFVVVGEGETLFALARRWNTTVAALMMTNDMVRSDVKAGARLKLPPPAPKR